MSSCLTSSAPLEFYLGGACAGHGTCVPSLRTAGLDLCKCDSWYSGASDFFDNRVEQLPDGTWLSLSCTESAVGTYITWVFFVLCGVLRAIQLVPLWLNYYKRHYKDEKLVAGGVWNDAPLRIVTTDLFGVGVPYFLTGFAKLAGMTVGTDPLPTISIVLFLLFFQLASYDLGKLEFDILVQGSASPEEANKAKKLRIMLKLGGALTYLLVSSTVTLWTLGTDKSEGPLIDGGNGEELVIYLRNFGAMITILTEVGSSYMIRRRVEMLRLVSGGKEDSAVAYIIAKMDAELKSYCYRLIFTMILYTVFSLPFMLPYQTYSLGLIVGLVVCKPLSKAFATEKEKRRATATSTTSRTSTRSLEHSKHESGGKDMSSVEQGRPEYSPATPAAGRTRTLTGLASKQDSSSLLVLPLHDPKRGSVSPPSQRSSLLSSEIPPLPEIREVLATNEPIQGAAAPLEVRVDALPA